ncbi:pentatricopeptide repeat-containing protein [Canna indica]|uniref:Pentatricopeptide repeat-containing protein n=1 Tax=Canna indica TaxID=4628 RepID=A0AAQ3JUI0_9LILI|nr:pentatricopeptide repeat-containing protein [Canna indica]
MTVAVACLRIRKPLLILPPLISVARVTKPISVSASRRVCSLPHCSPLCPPSSYGLPAISTSSRDRSVDPRVARANYAITQLTRQGKMADARQLFDETPHKDVISWTAMISGYIRCGMLREARELFEGSDAEKNVVTWTALLSGYVRSKRIKEAEELFQRMPEKNVVSWNTMVAGYAENGLVDEACTLFRRMHERNVVSWNTIVTALAQSGRISEAYRLFEQMPERDVISWTSMIAGLSKNGMVDEARAVFDRMPERNVVSWNAMVSGYAQNLRIEDAFYLFLKMPERDIVSWNTMITGFIQNKDLMRARNLFNKMKYRNVVTWTTMITGYVEDEQNEVALMMLVEMLMDGVKPNQATFVNVLVAASNLAALLEGKQIHQIVSKTIFHFDPFVNSALMSMYSKCGEIGIARKLFDLFDQKDLVCWNGMIAAYAHHGNGQEALSLFKEMRQSGYKPNDVTYVGLLSACSHSGLFDEGLHLFKSMMKDPSIKVREEHYACLVDICGRAGRLEEAASLVKGLQIGPLSTPVWGALLGGCNVHGDVKLGNLAAKKLIEAEPNNAGSYMLLSNIYASAGRWKEAANIRLRMKGKGLKKQPGCSWIEVGNRVHVFVVRDRSHSESDKIYRLLHDLHNKLKRAGYEPAVEQVLIQD